MTRTIRLFCSDPLTGAFHWLPFNTKSPLTDNGRKPCRRTQHGHQNGRLRRYCHQGASATPVYISINGSKVQFRDARTLWGMKNAMTWASSARMSSRRLRTIMRIGGAGEKLVSYASVTQRHTVISAGGLGAVFGNELLKAVVVAEPCPGQQPQRISQTVRRIFRPELPVMKNTMTWHARKHFAIMGGLPPATCKQRPCSAEEISGGVSPGITGQAHRLRTVPFVHHRRSANPMRTSRTFTRLRWSGTIMSLSTLLNVLGIANREDIPPDRHGGD